MSDDCLRIGPLLAEYSVGALDDRRARDVERHLAACERCQRRLAQLRATGEAVSATGLEEPPARIWSAVRAHVAAYPRRPAATRPWLRPRPVLAALVLVAVVVGIWLAANVLRAPGIEIVTADAEAASYLELHAAAAWHQPLADHVQLGATLARPVAEAEEVR